MVPFCVFALTTPYTMPYAHMVSMYNSGDATPEVSRHPAAERGSGRPEHTRQAYLPGVSLPAATGDATAQAGSIRRGRIHDIDVAQAARYVLRQLRRALRLHFMSLPVDFDPLIKWRKHQQRRAETRSFADRLKWENRFWLSLKEPRSDIPSTWPALEDSLRRYCGERPRRDMERPPLHLGFTANR